LLTKKKSVQRSDRKIPYLWAEGTGEGQTKSTRLSRKKEKQRRRGSLSGPAEQPEKKIVVATLNNWKGREGKAGKEQV